MLILYLNIKYNMLLHQTFKLEIPKNLIFDLLDQVCLKTDKYYFFDLNSYKKMLFCKLHTEFILSLREYYHTSKTFYLTREITYGSFTNILRQICKYSSIELDSEMKYNYSQYYINFYIYHNTELETQDLQATQLKNII
jgi:hypothetical protein